MRTQLAAALLAGAAAAAQAAPADEVRALLEQGKDREAYQLGRAAPGELGNPLFDFYFGIAALNAGAPGEGVLALERYLLHFPDNRAARFQLARGYFILGEDLRAREEFQALASAAQGAERDSVDRFLGAIRARESRYKPTATAFVEIGLGYDSNINSGVGAGQIAGLPDGFVVTPGQSSETQSDSFRSIALGVQGVYPVRPGWSLYGGATLTARAHSRDTSDVFDQETLALQGGVSVLSGRNLYRLGLDLTALNLDNQHYLDVQTVAGEWHHQADQFNRYGLSLQWSQQSYQNIVSFLDTNKTVPVSSASEVRDSRLTGVTVFWNRSVEHPWNPVLNLAANAAQEKNRRDRPDLSRDIWSVRASATVQPWANWTLGAGLAYQNARHDAEFAPGIEARRDDLATLDLSAIYSLDRHWSVRAEYQHQSQRSNIGLYQFERDTLVLKLRYDLN